MSPGNPRRRGSATTGECEDGLSRKSSMALRKGATFHSSPSSVPSSAATASTFLPPQLPRSSTHIDHVVDANRRRVALTLDDIDETLAKTERLSLESRTTVGSASLRDVSSPVPRGLLDLANLHLADLGRAPDGPAPRPTPPRCFVLPRNVGESAKADCDSGLGTSIASADDECCPSADAGKAGMSSSSQTLTGSSADAAKANLPLLGSKAYYRIYHRILGPLLAEPAFKPFKPLLVVVPRQIRDKEIICIRDLEKTLLFRAPRDSPSLYLDFCLTFIRCVQASVHLFTEREQVRGNDRPYTNGYFIDLEDQLLHYGMQLYRAKNAPAADDADMVDQSDEIQLYGGVAQNGRPAELVRVKKDGTAISMATGKPVDVGASLPLKRSASRQQVDEEDVRRSMARRKKNASPDELAPKKCRHHGCAKEFKRPCDLTKHEKTHSRPWKCPVAACKYHRLGWPTEKEMGRHINDRHSAAPSTFYCQYSCGYTSKRESNCKQHMEKAHGWTYVRTKTNGKKESPASDGPLVQQTPPLQNASTPSTVPSCGVSTPLQETEVAVAVMPAYVSDADWLATFGSQPQAVEALDAMPETPSPASPASYEQYPPYLNSPAFILGDEDIYAAQVQLPAHLFPNIGQLLDKLAPQNLPIYQMPHLPQPAAALAQPHLPPVPHFSPAGQGSVMLFSPEAAAEADEGFDESFAAQGADFALLSTAEVMVFPPLVQDPPSMNLGYSQNSQPDDMFRSLEFPPAHDFASFGC
ncbi:hypothetical protein RJ55_02475 [Drechmeria coniospora]|nr:hypothetical protein RJ55_02475 [Drechmeria coniospora]